MCYIIKVGTSMKKIISILFMILAIFAITACGDFVPETGSGNFWAQNIVSGKFYRVNAEKLAENSRCVVWAEKGSGVSNAQAENIARDYNNKIYQTMIDVFGIKKPSYNGRTYSDIMEFADFVTDRNGKICILLLDIKDDYKKGVNESYVAGYFWYGDFYNISGSNMRDMIYLDTNPGMTEGRDVNVVTTLAHEMQHMMNFLSSLIKRVGYDDVAYLMDTWIDEGLSSAAEYIINGGQHSQERIGWYNENGGTTKDGKKISGIIDKGNNFFVWGNHESDTYAILDDYATDYLFFQWLRIQKGEGIYRDIISSSYYNYQAVTSSVTTAMGQDWKTLLRNWMAANYLNKDNSVYGYKGEIPSLTTHTAPAGQKTVKLFPGEGVYSLTTSSDTMPTASVNIKYAGLNKTSSTVSDSSVYSSGALLTYNINTIQTDNAETGTTTGKASVNIAEMGRSVIPSYSGPYRIGAGDLHPRSENKFDFSSLNLKDEDE